METADQVLLESATVSSKQKNSHFEATHWEDIHKQTAGKKVVVFIPNEDVLLTSISIPSTNKKQLLQAVPYALEERLADDIESLHFTIHTEKESDLTRVAVINRKKMEEWLDLLREHSIHPHYILPSLYSIPFKAESWTLINKANKSYLRLDQWSGFSCDHSLLPIFLTEEIEKRAPEAVYYAGDERHYPTELKEFEKYSVDHVNAVEHDDVIDILALNLLTGFSRGDSALFNFNWKPWRPTAILASLIGVIWLGMMAWQNHLLDTKLVNLEAEIESVYKKTFPKSRIQNAPVQMSQKLKALQKNNGAVGGSPLQAIATVSPFLKKFPKIALKEIRRQNNELLFIISAPNLTRLEAFKNTLIKEGALKVEIKSSTTTADKVESTLVIKGVV
jgi:general secretion pathway protein L